MSRANPGPGNRKTLAGTKLGQDFLQTRANPPSRGFNPRAQSNAFTEGLGDTVGLNNIDQKRYQVLMQASDKGTPHGFDAVLQERATGKLVVLEQKGQGAKESSGQRNPAKWIEKVNEKTIARQGNYARSTQHEVEMSRRIQKAMREGQIEYQLQRTHVDKAGRVHVDTVKQVQVSSPLAARETAQGGPVRTSPLPPDQATRGAASMTDKKPVPPQPSSNTPKFEHSGFGEKLKPQPVHRGASSTSAKQPATGTTTSVPTAQPAKFVGFGNPNPTQTAGSSTSAKQPATAAPAAPPAKFVGFGNQDPAGEVAKGPPPKKAGAPARASDAPAEKKAGGQNAPAPSASAPSRAGSNLALARTQLAAMQRLGQDNAVKPKASRSATASADKSVAPSRATAKAPSAAKGGPSLGRGGGGMGRR